MVSWFLLILLVLLLLAFLGAVGTGFIFWIVLRGREAFAMRTHKERAAGRDH